jgi:two-component system, sensor histidine kinase and response regulator
MLQHHVPESKILIVDDNPRNLEILGKTLEKHKHYVEFAVDGEAALEWINNELFDLVLLDVMMPGMDGFEVCKQLRSSSKYDDIPVIFLTAVLDRKSIVTGLEIGAQDYVTKPFDAKELLARVNTQLELRHNREKLKSVNKWLEEKVKKRTEQFRKANEELMSLDNAKAEFLNIISHEIRTPLNGIVGPLQLLKERDESGELSELINVLDVSVTRLERFSLVALTITNLRTGKYKVQKQPVMLGELIDNSLEELDKKLREKNLQISKKMIPGEQTISGEFDLLRMCMINILLNAIKYSDNGGEIIIKTEKTGSDISCEIIDKGPGFSEEAMQKLFRLFAPGEQHINANIGLDLALVRMIVDAHNGRIQISNSPEGGAIVKIIFTIHE